MRLTLSGDGITDPDRVVVANWKRLNDASWTYESNQTRDFSLLPYSIDDSAIALYYEPATVASSTIRTATYTIDWEKEGAAVVATSTAAVTETAASEENSETVDAILTEVSGPGQGFLPQICKQWEAATQPAQDRGYGLFRCVWVSYSVRLVEPSMPCSPPFAWGWGAGWDQAHST